MFDVTFTTNYPRGVHVDFDPGSLGQGQGYPVYPLGKTYQFPKWSGYHTISVIGMGDINFLDLGDTKLKAYTNPKLPWTEKTWGGLIRYRGLDAYFRYEGTGHVTVVIDSVGSINLHFDQGGMMVNLDDMTVR